MKKILANESGVALLMVSTAIVILSMIMINFTYDSNINKLQAYNIEDKAKAKLMAESGLKFAMIRLRLYKEAFNYLEKNSSAKDMAGQEIINAIWNFPFVYPIPVSDKMNQIQQQALQEFMESSLLEGAMQLTIQNISNRMNLNMLRISKIELAKGKGQQTEEDEDDKNTYSVRAQLYKTLQHAIQKKSESDEEFANLYMGIDINNLLNILIAYLSDPETSQPMQNEFMDIDSEAKHAPMASFSEMYSLPLWTDDLVELIERDFTIHGGLMIDLNNVTGQTLRLLIPELMEEDILDFFKYKNDPNNNVFFNTVDQFKKYWVDQANAISSDDFDEIFKKFEAQGIKFGPAPTIFKVISDGSMGRANYKLSAYVVIPAQPQPETKTPTADDLDGDGIPNDEDDDIDGDGIKNDQDETPETPNTTSPKKEQKTQLLEPRIVEIFIN